MPRQLVLAVAVERLGTLISCMRVGRESPASAPTGPVDAWRLPAVSCGGSTRALRVTAKKADFQPMALTAGPHHANDCAVRPNRSALGQFQKNTLETLTWKESVEHAMRDLRYLHIQSAHTRFLRRLALTHDHTHSSRNQVRRSKSSPKKACSQALTPRLVKSACAAAFRQFLEAFSLRRQRHSEKSQRAESCNFTSITQSLLILFSASAPHSFS